MSLNRWCGIGNLGKSADIRYSQGGDAIANFSLAVSKRWTNRQTGERQEHTEWVRCVAFKKTAEVMEKYTEKGDKIYVEGELRTRKWQDKDGLDRYTTEIVAQMVQLLGSPEKKEPKPAGEDFDDDVPF